MVFQSSEPTKSTGTAAEAPHRRAVPLPGLPQPQGCTSKAKDPADGSEWIRMGAGAGCLRLNDCLLCVSLNERLRGAKNRSFFGLVRGFSVTTQTFHGPTGNTGAGAGHTETPGSMALRKEVDFGLKLHQNDVSHKNRKNRSLLRSLFGGEVNVPERACGSMHVKRRAKTSRTTSCPPPDAQPKSGRIGTKTSRT